MSQLYSESEFVNPMLSMGITLNVQITKDVVKTADYLLLNITTMLLGSHLLLISLFR